MNPFDELNGNARCSQLMGNGRGVRFRVYVPFNDRKSVPKIETSTKTIDRECEGLTKRLAPKLNQLLNSPKLLMLGNTQEVRILPDVLVKLYIMMFMLGFLPNPQR